MSFTILLPISNSHDSHIYGIQRQQNISDYTAVHELGRFLCYPMAFFHFPRPTCGSKDVLCNAALALPLALPISQKTRNTGL